VAARREKRPFCVGFAAETGEVAQKAMEKCQRKACDLVVGNDVSGGSAFGSHENQVWLVDREASLAQVGPASKLAVARQLWAHIVERFERRK
jgi:phosphopantothenoylcysteine decarboxylase/phosphopantothenate--cysteine ligase